MQRNKISCVEGHKLSILPHICRTCSCWYYQERVSRILENSYSSLVSFARRPLFEWKIGLVDGDWEMLCWKSWLLIDFMDQMLCNCMSHKELIGNSTFFSFVFCWNYGTCLVCCESCEKRKDENHMGIQRLVLRLWVLMVLLLHIDCWIAFLWFINRTAFVMELQKEIACSWNRKYAFCTTST